MRFYFADSLCLLPAERTSGLYQKSFGQNQTGIYHLETLFAIISAVFYY